MNKKKQTNKKSMICLPPKPNQSFFVYRIQSKENVFFCFFFTEKELFKEKRGLSQNEMKILIALDEAIKKDPTTSIRKHTNEFKVHEKTVRTPIKRDLSSGLKPLEYTIWGVFENKTRVTSHRNIGSLKTTSEEEWNKMSGELILKACKSFRWCVDRTFEEEW